MVDIPIRCFVSTDTKYPCETPGKCKTKSCRRSNSSCYGQCKYIFLIVAASILLTVTLLRLTYFITFMSKAHNASVGIQPESRVQRIIRASHPLGKRSLSETWMGKIMDQGPSFNDRTKLTNRITRDARGNAFPAINEVDTETQEEEISRLRRDCEVNAKFCETLLQRLEGFLKIIKDKFPTTDNGELKSAPNEILKCLKCKDLQFTSSNEFDGNNAPQSKDLYLPHDYAKENRSSDSGVAIVKLTDNEETMGSNMKVNRTGAAKVQVTVSVMNVSQVVANRSLLRDRLEITTVSFDRTESNESPQMPESSIDIDNTTVNNDERSNNNITANDSLVVNVENDESTTVVDRQNDNVTNESEIITSDIAATQSIATNSRSASTQYGAIDGNTEKTAATVDSIDSTESGTRSSIYVMKQTAITENVTNVPAYDVTGIDSGYAVHPSEYPSEAQNEGHPEDRSNVAMNGSRSIDSYRAFQQTTVERFQKDNAKPIPATAESTKSFQQLQLTPTMWSTPQFVCFYPGYPGQSPSSSGAAFYPDSSAPSAPSNRVPTPQNQQNQQDTPQSNYMQVQANMVQFMPRFNYAGNQGQSMGQDIGPTGPATSNVPMMFPLNQQTQQQPIANAPYFCGYMSLPTLRFPPIPGTSHSDRSADQTEDLPGGVPSGSPKDDAADWHYSGYFSTSQCPVDYYQCDNLACIPKMKWCDGFVDCTDASDETRCSCKDRISRDRLCDGYFDCPRGEDELGCFDCPTDSFSCDNSDNRYSRVNCVPLSQRCDGINQCFNGKDELECNILTESYLDKRDRFMVGYTQGYLHKNVRGQWYPVCSNTPSWAMDACASEIGQPVTMMPSIRIVRVPEDTFHDPYVKEFNGQMEISSCPGTAVFVKCPPLPCFAKAHPRLDSSRYANATRADYAFGRNANEKSVSETTKFNRLYQETLGLLDPISMEMEVQDENETLVGSQSRVVGGRASRPRAWPFLVAIYRDGYFHCGGVIVNEAYVLTAAHCMEEYKSHYYEVQAGMLRRLSSSPMAQMRRAKQVFVHRDYESEHMQNDIAIIMLDEDFLYNRWVRQVCLPELNTAGLEWIHGPSPQSMCVAIGWGAVKENGPDPDHLREVEVPILPSCKYISDHNDATICAGYPEGGHDACQGDSGGPLMCRNPNLESQWYIAGMISHGDGCARPNEPGVYMKISYYIDWIQQTMKVLNNFEIPSTNKPLNTCPGFSCQGGLRNCLPKQYRCNKFVDCLDGEDEIACDDYKQSNDESTEPQIEEIFQRPTQNRMDTETNSIFTPFNPFNKIEAQTDNNENSSTENIDVTTPDMIMSEVRFTCKSLIQTITIDKRCDKHLDCEDGTDEDNCTCRDYLSSLQPTAICDGHLDCDDKTDEINCGICNADEFHCHRSGKCIPIKKRCNADFDCPLREDELDCLALTDGEYLYVDESDRPILNMEGMLSRHYKGKWQVQCFQPETLNNNTVTSRIAKNLCEYLGFANVQSSDKIVVNRTILETRYSQRWDSARSRISTSTERVAPGENEETCATLRIRCRPVLSNSADSHVIADPRTGNYTYLWPWLAAIFVDGSYRCSALLLEPDWLLSSSSCTEDIRLSVNYTTALLGQSRSYLYVDGPHQQISLIDEIRDARTSNVTLLHLKTAVNFTRYVQPLFLEKKIYPPEENDLCVAVGTDKEHVIRSIFLRTIVENCDKCYRCFVKSSGTECPSNGTSSNLDGVVFCRSENGWYPSALFDENDDLCSFQRTPNLTSIDYIHAYISQALGKEVQSTPGAACNGVRCNIGQCVPWIRVCDGVTDCRDGADETDDMCIKKTVQIRSKNGAKCSAVELRCRNGQCVPKSAFCDGKVDCSDGTDEPVMCTCAEYLKLTAPGRLCDGVRHCFDKTDESPEVCHCAETSFKCNAGSKNLTCVSQDFVCDGDDDCPNGEDEAECRKVTDSTNNGSAVGEVKQRSYGVWHSQCFTLPVTSQNEARDVCREMGYADGIIDRENKTLDKPVVPSRDDFYMIRLNRNAWITMRDDKPLITLVQSKEPCYRLFVKCN